MVRNNLRSNSESPPRARLEKVIIFQFPRFLVAGAVLPARKQGSYILLPSTLSTVMEIVNSLPGRIDDWFCDPDSGVFFRDCPFHGCSSARETREPLPDTNSFRSDNRVLSTMFEPLSQDNLLLQTPASPLEDLPPSPGRIRRQLSWSPPHEIELTFEARLERVRYEVLRQQREATQPRRGSNSSKTRSNKKCKFCLKNGEPADIVFHHSLKDKQGGVTCPLLQQYRCELCGASGRNAHTIKFCPLNDHGGVSIDRVMKARRSIQSRNKEECGKVTKRNSPRDSLLHYVPPASALFPSSMSSSPLSSDFSSFSSSGSPSLSPSSSPLSFWFPG